MTGVAQRFRDTACEGRRRLARMDDIRERRGRRRHAAFRKQQDHAFDPDGEAAGAGVLAAQLRKQPVVATAAGNRVLRALLATHGDELEHAAIVVIEAANEARIDLEAQPRVGQQRLQTLEMRERRVGEEVDERGGAFEHRPHRLILAVEDAQRVGVQPPSRVGVEQVRVAFEMRDQRVAMSEPLGGVADRIDLQSDIGKAERLPQAREHHDLLGVDVGTREAERLDIDLVELPIAAFLRALVAEHRAAGPDPLRALVDQVVLDGGAHDAGRRLRAQRQRLAVQLVLERVHLVLDHIRVLADAAHEQRRRFHDGHAHVPIAVLRKHGTRGVLETLP